MILSNGFRLQIHSVDIRRHKFTSVAVHFIRANTKLLRQIDLVVSLGGGEHSLNVSKLNFNVHIFIIYHLEVLLLLSHEFVC